MVINTGSIRGKHGRNNLRKIILRKGRSIGKSTSSMFSAKQLAKMTHGHIHFVRHDGVVVAEAYAYHDGNIAEAFQLLAEIPRILVERWRRFTAFRSSAEARDNSPLVPSAYHTGLIKEWGRSNLLKDYFATAPDFVTPQVSNLANWFCSMKFDHWMIIPQDEQSYPGPGGIVRELDEGVFELDNLLDTTKTILCWPHEILMSMNIYKTFIPDYMRDRFNPE
jgi:hypothetical protein